MRIPISCPPLLLTYLLCATLAGCEYNTLVEEPVYEAPPPRYIELEPTLQSIERDFFVTTCTFSMCHNSTLRVAGLDLSRDTSYDNLVNMPSFQDPAILRVHPGKPDSSYLIWKLEGHPEMEGRLMPICATQVQCLDTRVIDVVKEWIANGAPDHSSE